MKYLIHDNVSPLANIIRAGKTNYPDLIKAPEGQTMVEVRADEIDFAPHTHRFDLTTGRVVPITADPGVALAATRMARDVYLTDICKRIIEGGFISSATGAALYYPSASTDQQNILLGGLLMTKNSDNVWVHVSHTETQSAQVRTDFIAHRDTARSRLAARRAALAGASTLGEIQAIGW